MTLPEEGPLLRIFIGEIEKNHYHHRGAEDTEQNF